MKKIVGIFLLTCLFSCEVEENTPSKPIDDDFDASMATKLKMGTLVGIGGHTATGTATLYEEGGQKFVVLDPYESQNGPDLKVYLSKNVSASSYINLGPLKSVMGKQAYPVPGNPNINEYGYVHIWCEQYSVEFGRAQLQ
ncbi:MAG TPA: DM13 domain-containing protein [Cyclobacteriaceae bacterium]|nr:DM13 domain-containing protein [Cyclobacteriaceae bacterium]